MARVYNLFILLYTGSIRFWAHFNPKAKQWVEGRKGQFKRMKKALGKHDEVLWFHCASLGEFEQGRPIMEAVRKAYPHVKILLTFFSPSGYELRKEYQGADAIFYLPADTPSQAKKFIKIFQPKMAIFVKYEFWYNYINELYKNKIPLLMVSAIFRPRQHFFHFWGYWFRQQLQKISFFFVQNETSSQLLTSIGVYHHEIGGDTRFDRVSQIVDEKRAVDGIDRFKNGKPLLVAGSTWPPDEDILQLVLEKESGLQLVIAPHVVDEAHIEELLRKFGAFHPILYSKKEPICPGKNSVLIIDNMGLLSYLYRYADIAYVGGGFGVGIHNLPEAAVFGVPVLFGPNHKRFQEATDLLEKGGGFTFETGEQAVKLMHRLLSDDTLRRNAGKAAANYILKNRGATALILDKIKEYLLGGG